MTEKEQFHSLTEELLFQFLEMNKLCKRYEKRHTMREAAANTVLKRAIDAFTGRHTHLRDDEIDPFEDKSIEMINKLEQLEAYFIDIKNRYLMALRKIAEQDIYWMQRESFHRKSKDGRIFPLRDKGNIFGERMPKQGLLIKRDDKRHDFDVVQSENESEEQKDEKSSMKVTKWPTRVITKFRRSSSLLKSDEVPDDAMKYRSSNPRCSASSSRISKEKEGHCLGNNKNQEMPKQRLLIKRDDKRHDFDVVQSENESEEQKAHYEETIEAKYKMNILALQEEIREKNEHIDILISQLKIKSLEVERLIEALPNETMDNL